MMGIFKLSHSNTWIKCSKRSYWGLQQSFQNDCWTLEGNLYAICNQLALHNPLALLDTKPCPLPHSYGYLKLHKTCKLAEQAIQSSLNGFMVLTGNCSFLLIHRHFIHPTDLRYLWELDLIKPPIWLNAIEHPKFQPLAPEIIQAIKNSELVDFAIPHAGVIVSTNCQFLRDIKIFIHHNILVYFFWGKGSITQCFVLQFHFDIYYPRCADIEASLCAYQASLQALQSREQKKPFPKHPPDSVQKCYKGPWDYLNRRVYEIADFYRCADPVEKQAFKQRAAAQCNFPVPGFPNFFWDDDEDKYSGYIVRVPYGCLRTS